ncbi:MAG: carboxylating nicotinate-nucleotide diphosphorylase [Candidatus Neomarinimicrobiota bacterium]|jgi:nicotinate-nucleotide pyrophosphorylase (carboxylating)|nr:carboxylating nicotinate-nucleotide diphosphorylase [Candidatus Neomarinimicrobiota bacterium]MDX9780805.1 carboxylating nicotinate-nucleotide diphosphorylase [bacterium]
MQLPDQKITDPILLHALEEDIGGGDVTVQAMRVDAPAKAQIIAKEAGIAAGIPIAARVFELLDPNLQIDLHKQDGENLYAKDLLLSIKGKGASILSAERTALNFLGRMCGIATLSARYVRELAGTRCKIYDTRKTLPNLRVLDKYAVTCGGAENHRQGLYDMILIKENHIRWAGGIDRALQAALPFARKHGLKIEIEVTDLEEYRRALKYPVQTIMLDHFTPGQIREAVGTEHGDILLEASGNISLETVGDIARCGVDIISVGALTHSAKCLDLSLLFHV